MEKVLNPRPIRIIFLSLVKIDSIYHRGIYHDLLRQFATNNHQLYIVCPVERKEKKESNLITHGNAKILQVKTLNIQKTSFIEKAISTLTLSFLFKNYFNKFI